MVLYWFWVPSETSFSIKKLEKQRFGTTRSGHEKMVRKTSDFWVAGTSKSEPPSGREHDFDVLSKSRKTFNFGVVLVPSFGAFGVSYRRKRGFQRCFIFARFLNRLLHHFKPPKSPPKACKMGIHFWNHFWQTFLAWEREARLSVRVLVTCGRSLHRLVYIYIDVYTYK